MAIFAIENEIPSRIAAARIRCQRWLPVHAFEPIELPYRIR